MKTYLNDIIPRLARHSERLDDIAMLVNKRWVLFDEFENQKTVYFFKKNYDLIISINGNVERGNWELIDNDYLSIKTIEGEFMFKKDFNDDNLFALKKDNVNEYAIFINETVFDQKNFKTIDSLNVFLEKENESRTLNIEINDKLSKDNLYIKFLLYFLALIFLIAIIYKIIN